MESVRAIELLYTRGRPRSTGLAQVLVTSMALPSSEMHSPSRWVIANFFSTKWANQGKVRLLPSWGQPLQLAGLRGLDSLPNILQMTRLELIFPQAQRPVLA